MNCMPHKEGGHDVQAAIWRGILVKKGTPSSIVNKLHEAVKKMLKDPEYIKYANQIFSIIVRGKFHKPGINFFTPNDFSQQLAYMSHPKGKDIQPHVHKKVQREVFYTQETLFIRKGKLQVDFYSNDQKSH